MKEFTDVQTDNAHRIGYVRYGDNTEDTYAVAESTSGDDMPDNGGKDYDYVC